MKSLEMRKKFFDFFEARGHTKVRSSSLIPAQDPTLLFTNAGMNQFKDLFLGKEKRNYARAVSIQKCMRAGGKHSDLDNVGFTGRHLTFFEMMGNFSFGDYFKKDAIQFAWDFLTKEMKFDPQTMYATVFRDDHESYDIWHKHIKLPKERISRLGETDNFWQMGDTGPCGPCSEIYVDRGTKWGCGKKTCAPGCSCDRFLEVWNLVFMQFDRQADGTLNPLKQTGVDTGMGLERLCVIMQDKGSVFETDLFEHVIKKIEILTGISYDKAPHEIRAAFNVLCDHTRSATFLIADGATPSNEGRGYVLRKIIRRAALFMQKISKKNILPELAQVVIQDMASIYPELLPAQTAIKHILSIEVEKFAHNLQQGQQIVQEYMRQEKNNIISGKQAFKLYDTYGFPLELTRVIAGEHGFSVDIEGFDQEMEQQKTRSGAKIEEQNHFPTIPAHIKTEFTGFKELETPGKIIGIIENGELKNTVSAGSTVWIIADRSPFYVEKGGQVSDEGTITFDGKSTNIMGLKKIDHAIAIALEAPINIKVGMPIISKVDQQFRLDVMNNHTATHLLQAALIELLGKEVKQSGSLVHPNYLRFDFTYHKPLTHEQITAVENRVNEKIRENIPLNIFETSYDDALSKGVIAIFGEKYNPEKVRVIDIKNFSAELCGGTHVRATGDIGCFKVTQEMALSTGQRRIVALTGRKAIALFQENFDTVKTLAHQFKIQQSEVVSAVSKQQEELKNRQTHLKKLKKQSWQQQISVWLAQAQEQNGINVALITITDAQPDELREIAQLLCEKKPGLYCVLHNEQGKSSFVCMISPTIKKQIPSLKPLADLLNKELNLKSGGNDDSIQGGGPQIDEEKMKKLISDWIKQN